jgi:uncharacterized protein (TIGR02001 family)
MPAIAVFGGLFACPAIANSEAIGPAREAEFAGSPEDADSSSFPARAPLEGSASGLSAGGLQVSAELRLASEYRFRGIDLSGGKPAVQGSIDLSHGSGFYAGTFVSSIDNATTGYGSLELDFYAGWSDYVGDGLIAGAGIIAYTFPDAPAGDFDYYELYGSLTFLLGPAEATVGANWDPERRGLEFAGLRRDNLYVYTDLSSSVPATPLRINAHLGYTDGALNFAGENQSFDWSLGLEWSLRDAPFTLGVAYVDAASDVSTGAFNPTDAALVATLDARF